ncbi:MULTISPECIES: transporter substrate-binding domain-containing protein [Thalassotalea]|uniref:Transporter substrate-binding domain-containing protein n=1 Tax=Thalassotalea castellviae TaxID=3075612 RepID=A0ABU2ZXB1_9GAMM|nr:transporter substrate-binding domain-containing protein [Thalassotalea sp. W431]MDT0602180.1 transporter substrate-binding domain-containing protein [Thalassotalea sp. W431]
MVLYKLEHKLSNCKLTFNRGFLFNVYKVIISFFFCLISLQLNANEQAAQPEITFYTEVYPPANYFENGELKGITVDTLKAIWQELKQPEQFINIVPWARGYRNTLDKPNSALFTMSRTPPREKLFKWVGPIFNSTHVIMTKKSNQFNFTELTQLFEYKVAAVRGDISEISLIKLGFPNQNIAKVTELKLAYKMMETGRVDMLVATIHGFQHLAQQLNFDHTKYENVWQVNKFANYIAFNIETPDSIIKQYQTALNNISEEHLQIKQKYKLALEEY